MEKTNIIPATLIRRKLAILLLIAVSTAGAFATLGDGKFAKDRPLKSSLLVNKSQANSFSLRSGYSFRGSQVINNSVKYVNINSVITYQRGNATYTLPVKKKVILQNVKISLGNRQFQRN